MKNLIISLVTLCVMVSFSPASVFAAEVVPGSKTVPVESAEMQLLVNRINEIKAMDKSTMSRAEKKELRSELKDAKKELREGSRGLYLSLGAIVIIILLLILLL